MINGNKKDILNWDREVEKVNVKTDDEPIYVDACCADAVRYIDALPETRTVWCCCNHKRTVGGVEFITKLPFSELIKYLDENKISRLDFHDGGAYIGYNFEIECHCSGEVVKRNEMR